MVVMTNYDKDSCGDEHDSGGDEDDDNDRWAMNDTMIVEMMVVKLLMVEIMLIVDIANLSMMVVEKYGMVLGPKLYHATHYVPN